MMSIEPNLDIDGTFPLLIGEVIDSMICEQFWYNDVLEDSANVIHLLINKNWHRLYFDCGIVFWRKDSTQPKRVEYTDDEGFKVEYKLHDLLKELNLKSPVVSSVLAKDIKGGCMVEFLLNQSVVIKFQNIHDTSSYST